MLDAFRGMLQRRDGGECSKGEMVARWWREGGESGVYLRALVRE